MDRQRGRHRARPSHGTHLLRAAAATVLVGGVALAVTAAGPGHLERLSSTVGADERFGAAVQEQGRATTAGPPDPLVVSAARKVCERRAGTDTPAVLRRSALTAAEVAAVRRTFGDDAEAFLKVARRTYCPLGR